MSDNVRHFRETLEKAKVQHADVLSFLVQTVEETVASNQTVTGIAFVIFSKEEVTEKNEETGEEEVVEENEQAVPFYMLEGINGPVEYALSHAGNLLSYMGSHLDEFEDEE